MHKSITLKFKTLDSIEVDLERVRQIPGVVKIECVFPHATSAARAALYTVQVETSIAKEVVQKLVQDPAIQSAYEAPERRSM